MSNHKNKIWTKDFVNISLTQFIVFVAFYTLLTTLPIFVLTVLDGSEAQGGLVVTSMLTAAIIIRPFSGKLLEKVGKRNGLIWSTVLFTATMFFYAGIDSFLVLMILRFIHGLSFGVLTTATSAIAADVVPEERRGAGLGYFAMSMNIAMVVGPFLGLTLIQYISFESMFIIISLFMAIGAICALQVHVTNEMEQEELEEGKKFSIHELIEVRAVPIAIISLFVGIAYSSILSYVSVFANALDLASVASYFFVVFAIVMIISRPSLGQLFDVRGPSYVIIPCLVVFSIGLILLSITNNAWLFLIAAAVIGLGSGSLLPSFQTMCIQTAKKGRSGHATATFFIFWDIGIATGSYVLGLIVAMFSFQVLYLVCAGLLVVVLGLFIVQQASERSKTNAA
ncbi:MFS transporter [Ornithinibacillus xuwenensis]|uniref:MFS transporter n=1 Tax=Ornithinibacillus xuwenensis TaxID=3144668 RepID=A0ABU9XK35_9BACI